MKKIPPDLFSNQLIGVDSKDISLCKKIVFASFLEKEQLMKDLQFLWEKYSLDLVLKIVYLQQLKSGFILSDPANYFKAENQNSFYDPDTQIRFLVQWNPERALRKNHKILIKRGIIKEHIDTNALINKDKKGKACYLCKKNIDLQNPKEIVLPLKLDEELFYIGANFASISDNHFTVFHHQHRPQKYRKKILSIMMDFLNKTNGVFRIIYNGLAGASIEAHEHFQTTSIQFPVESIKCSDQNIIYKHKDVQVIKPDYYLPLWIFEGKKESDLICLLGHFIRYWHSLKSHEHTENILGIKIGSLFRFFIFLRERSKLKVPGKAGALATFEASGLFVFSEFSENTIGEKSKKNFFSSLSLDIMKNMLKKIAPAINPESPKNIDLSPNEITRQCKKFNIPRDKPIITQVSRFDRLKDPMGVIKIFKKVKSKIDCRLVLCGSMAVDDPEGIQVYEQILNCAQKMIDNKDIIIFSIENDILVNVLQRVSSVIVQKSIREGLGLTVSEALWKETPVVASNVGGIPLQITDGENGFLVKPLDYNGFADRIIYLLENPSKAEQIGKKGKEIVREKFLNLSYES